MPKNNFWVYDNYHFEEAIDKALVDLNTPPSLACISFPFSKDPNWKTKLYYTNYKEFVKESFLEIL